MGKLLSYSEHRDRADFIGLYGRRSGQAHESRIAQRYKFLKAKFGLTEEEARQLAIALEKWWKPDGA